jgi:hypothetical protein
MTRLTHPAGWSDAELLAACAQTTTRRRGPGGQHRNKTESAVVLKHSASGVIAQAAERRSQPENRRVALKRLRINLALAVRLPRTETDPPSELWRSRCHHGKIVLNPAHADYAPLLAEVLDIVSVRQGKLAKVAEDLGCTTSQLIKFLQDEPRAWKLARGLSAAEDSNQIAEVQETQSSE